MWRLQLPREKLEAGLTSNLQSLILSLNSRLIHLSTMDKHPLPGLPLCAIDAQTLTVYPIYGDRNLERMMNLKTSLDALTMEAAVLGGAVLGTGGGTVEWGMTMLRDALAEGIKGLESFRTEFGLNQAAGPRYFGFDIDYVPIEEIMAG